MRSIGAVKWAVSIEDAPCYSDCTRPTPDLLNYLLIPFWR